MFIEKTINNPVGHVQVKGECCYCERPYNTTVKKEDEYLSNFCCEECKDRFNERYKHYFNFKLSDNIIFDVFLSECEEDSVFIKLRETLTAITGDARLLLLILIDWHKHYKKQLEKPEPKKLTDDKILDLAYKNNKLKHNIRCTPAKLASEPFAFKQVIWKHKESKKLYRVDNVVTNEADLTTMVVYEMKEDPKLSFVRPYSEFVKKFERV